MIELTDEVARLVCRYRRIYRQRMQGLPIVNPALAVEAVAFGAWCEHQLGVLITPWFMNLVLLPGSVRWQGLTQGSKVELKLPAGPCEFTVCRDDAERVYLSAALFGTVAEFPDRCTAREIAREIIRQVRQAPRAKSAGGAPRVSRRHLLTRLGAP